MSHAAWLVPPGFLLAGSRDHLLVHDVLGGGQLSLEGSAAHAAHAGEHSGVLAVLSRCEPTGALEGLRNALAHCKPLPLTRASLLRGNGYGQLFIELTAQCNERCVHCYAESSPERTEHLTEAVVRSALEDAAELGFERVQLTGGDPLISPLCVPAAEYAAELGIENLEIYTNGLALLGRVYDRLAALRTRFAFSFYSHDPKAHDAITRTPGSQRRTLAAIRRATSDGLRVRASVILMEQNRDHLEPTLALLRDAGVAADAIGVDVQRSVGRGLMTIRPKDASALGAPAFALGGHREPSANAGDLFTLSGRAAVAYDGTVFPCIFSRGFPLGHLPEQRLREVLADETPLEVDPARLAGEYSRRQDQLACWDCRMRATVLGMQSDFGAKA